MGIEPTSEAWEASILPLNYARSLARSRLYTTQVAFETSETPRNATPIDNSALLRHHKCQMVSSSSFLSTGEGTGEGTEEGTEEGAGQTTVPMDH